ncbi:Demethylsterigmatocystin 6-O-methyltransferase [Cytospora mali]|uniref:Demethylsterigmatocystin 6-O-methyltransferase n=1 Tax=Cytospora mali TaxID=578113 RepID=A0A194UNQ6_CYTMA|nr:Demethylsterigmatocystin 6-O-methyltransferase [Valsa mali var. pyri (nom. inval.)]
MGNTSIASLIEDIVLAGKGYDNNAPGSRESLLDLSHALVAALELPSEFVQRSMWAEPALSGINRIAVDLKLFQHLRDAGERGLTIDELASKTGAEAALLARLMRHVVAMRLLSFAEGRLLATPLSNGLAEDNFQKTIEFCYDCTRPSFSSFPEYFKLHDYKDRVTPIDGPFQFALSREKPLHFFPWLEANPPNLSRFASYMSAYRAGHSRWWDTGFYPVKERLIDGFDSSVSDVLLIDVGGGQGHDLDLFVACHADRPGRVILQDQESVISSIPDKSEKPYEVQSHDFFTTQPVKAARGYSMHSILHDWDDKDSLRILENLKPALKPGQVLSRGWHLVEVYGLLHRV